MHITPPNNIIKSMWNNAEFHSSNSILADHNIHILLKSSNNHIFIINKNCKSTFVSLFNSTHIFYFQANCTKKRSDYTQFSIFLIFKTSFVASYLFICPVLQGIPVICEMCDLPCILAKQGKMRQVIAGCQ